MVDMFPQVFVIDKDNVISGVFPKANDLLCRFQANKNVKVKFKMSMDFVKAWKFVMDAWAFVMDCRDRDAYIFVECVKRFVIVCSS